ncbi:hypothetical protein ACFQY7_13150 [Actinomadura luteofluorescens]|uniref:hypothetical protein n=1 Tax=Actinomadura luteofluorescens TaxID=46163 RepID=UPI00363967B2
MTAPNHRDPRSLARESDQERDVRERLTRLLRDTPIPAEYLIDNLALYLRRHQLTDLLCMDALYRMILDVPGVIMEFGVLHGRHLATLTALRGCHEPYTSVRRVIGFDTFTGFPDVADVDRAGPGAVARAGSPWARATPTTCARCSTRTSPASPSRTCGGPRWSRATSARPCRAISPTTRRP